MYSLVFNSRANTLAIKKADSILGSYERVVSKGSYAELERKISQEHSSSLVL